MNKQDNSANCNNNAELIIVFFIFFVEICYLLENSIQHRKSEQLSIV